MATENENKVQDNNENESLQNNDIQNVQGVTTQPVVNEVPYRDINVPVGEETTQEETYENINARFDLTDPQAVSQDAKNEEIPTSYEDLMNFLNEARQVRTPQQQTPATGQGMRSFFDDEEEQPQVVEEQPQVEEKPKISEQLKQQRPIMSSRMQSWFDDDEETDSAAKEEQNKKEEKPEQEVEDPMAELRATMLNDMTKKPTKSEGLSIEEQQKLLDIAEQVGVHGEVDTTKEEKEALSEIHQRILSSLPEDKVFTAEETRKIDEMVAQAKEDELEEQSIEAFVPRTVNQNVGMPLPEEVNLAEEETPVNDGKENPSQNSSLNRFLFSDEDEPLMTPLSYELRSQRPVPSSQLQAFLNEDDEETDSTAETEANDKQQVLPPEETEDFVDTLRTAIQNDKTKEPTKSEGLSIEEQQKLLDQAEQVGVHGEVDTTKEEKEALSEIHQRILSSFPVDKVFTEEETRKIDEMVAQAIQDEKEERKAEAEKPEGPKPDISDVFLPDIELEEEEEQPVENKDEPLKLAHSRALLYDDEEDETETEKERAQQTSAQPAEAESDVQGAMHIPDFYDKLNRRFESTAVTAQVKAQLAEIIKESGVMDAEQASTYAEESYPSLIEDVKNIYNPKNVPDTKMSEDAPMFFNMAYLTVTDNRFSPKDRIITSQKIADLMLKNYSPVAFADGKLDRYADNYVVKNSGMLKNQLSELYVSGGSIEALTQEVQVALGYAKPKEPEVNHTPEQTPELTQTPEPTQTPATTQNTEPVQDTVPQPDDDIARVSVFTEKLATFNRMYKTQIEGNKYASYVSDAWTMMKSEDAKKQAEGKNMMSTLFKSALQMAFDKEKTTAYNEHRLPEYTEIIKSSNELLRASMYAFTDLYHDKKSAELFDRTAFGGMKAGEMAELTKGDSPWSMDQKSDEAWEIQSQEAKDITAGWLKEPRPYDKMLKEMEALRNGKKDITGRKDAMMKLAAAEWLLVNDARMMIEDPNDPINPIPNWGNRYWKAITETREALGIDKHTSMRDMIQAEYAVTAKAVNSPYYNTIQIKDNVMAPYARNTYDSMEKQKEQFATQSAHAKLTEKQSEKQSDEIVMDADRVQISIKVLDQRMIMKNEPKEYNFTVEPGKDLNLTISDKGVNSNVR